MKKISLLIIAALFVTNLWVTAQAQAITINVKNSPYNAKGDGITDDTAAIQKAVDDAYTQGGGSTGQGATVYFPEGTYIVTQVFIRDNITYEGQNKDTTIIKRPPAPVVGTEPIAITRAKSCQITTATTHGLDNGDQVFLENITQADWSKLNNASYMVRKIDNTKIIIHPWYSGRYIEAMVAGNPTTLKIGSHNLTTGDSIRFYDITQAGWLDLNNKDYTITKVDDDTFTIAYNSTGYVAYNPDTSPGVYYKNVDTSNYSANYNPTDPGLLHKQDKWMRTFTNQWGYAYSGTTDSKPLIIKNLTFDGNSQNQGPYQDYELEQAALVFLTGNDEFEGRLKSTVEDCYFKDGVGDGLSAWRNIDITVNNVTAKDVFRGGFVSSGDNDANNRVRLTNFTTMGKTDPGGIDFEGYGDADGIKPSVIYMENVNLLDGDFDVGVEPGTIVEGKNIFTDAPTLLYAQGATMRFSDSKFGNSDNWIYFPYDVTFENCEFFATEKEAVEQDRELYAAPFVEWSASWYTGQNQSLTFNDCKFTVAGNVDPTDTVYAICTGWDDISFNNILTLNGCSISKDFDIGINTGFRGGHWRIKDTVIEAKLPFRWLGYADDYGNNNTMDIVLDGVNIKSNGYMHILGYSSLTPNKLEHKNMQMDESANVIYSTYGLEGNTYAGSRLILGTNTPTNSTHGLIEDIYRLKNPVSGQVHEWKCDDPGYYYVDDPGNVTGANTAKWTPLPKVSVIATLSGTPSSPSSTGSATITVAGSGVTAYKYKLDSDTSFGPETPIATPISLTNLANGTHTVYVIGKNSSGVWQPTDRATTYTWLIQKDTTAVLYGDVSGDGSITAYDASLAAQYAVGSITLTADQITKADVSGDGGVSAYDASLIAQYAVGLINKFPVEG